MRIMGSRFWFGLYMILFQLEGTFGNIFPLLWRVSDHLDEFHVRCVARCGIEDRLNLVNCAWKICDLDSEDEICWNTSLHLFQNHSIISPSFSRPRNGIFIEHHGPARQLSPTNTSQTWIGKLATASPESVSMITRIAVL
ncbi:uncharacterized protein YALI1_D28437g [Yarrowia lipolytica]|uniref:Uncharacterized protein n=1 Tax=Yarrowia lipolytica TaxID=4952 RepID=A0A1D8NFS6_YARLL|nr:hypothetical protein YALI1_D28437g [Yarrowia lipolytica]